MNIYIGEPKIIILFDTQGPCPDGFHVPLKTEWEGLQTIMSGLGLTTGNNWKINLHMPFAGDRYYSSAYTEEQNSSGSYWSSSPMDSSHPVMASYFYINSSNARFYGGGRGTGYPIRPFKNTYKTPDSTWTVITGTLGSAGIFWNQTEGLISITSDGSTGYTIMDKNLGATTVYNNGDTLSEANCGKYYQWGNNYGFAWTGSVTTSSTHVDASSYGPGNYYDSSTFITDNDWASVPNDNLRGGVSQGTSTKTIPQEVQNIYIGEYIPPYEGPLRFTANTAGSTIKLQKSDSPAAVTLETSTNGTTWSTYTMGSTITLSNVGDKVYWRNTSTTNTQFSTSGGSYQFVMTGSISAAGDTNYLINKNSTTKMTNLCFVGLFRNCSALTTAPQLPATTLAYKCYRFMFYNCTNLKTAPSIPATTLTGEECCYSMFSGCSNLEQIPKFPATTLSNSCYNSMFNGCSKIKLSTTQTGTYQTAYRIPTSGTGTAGNYSLSGMFDSTGGSFKGTPTINTTYYTSNTVV